MGLLTKYDNFIIYYIKQIMSISTLAKNLPVVINYVVRY